MAQTNGHFQIPRSLLTHPTVMSSPLIHFKILIYVCNEMAYADCTQDDHGVEIHLRPYQYMATYRQIADACECDKSDVERFVRRFSKVKIIRQEVRHIKSIITVEYIKTYFEKINDSETRKETKVRQEKDKSETQKNNEINKEGNNTHSFIHEDFDSFSENWVKIAEAQDPGLKLHGTEIEKVVKKYQIPMRDIIPWIKSFSADFIIGTIAFLESQYSDTLFAQLQSLRDPNDLIMYVMLCKKELVPLLNSALHENYLKKPKKTKKKDPPTAVGLSMAKKLYETILSYHQSFSKPDFMEWAYDFDKMTEKGIEPDEIYQVINWLPSSEFWQSHVLSASYLRKKFDKLILQSRTATKHSRAYSGAQRLTEYDDL